MTTLELETPVPMLDTTAEVAAQWDELSAAFSSVLRSGQYVLGPHVQHFEEEVAGRLGVPHAVGVNSGTDALVIGLRALGIGPGDEVLTPTFTFFATAEAVSAVGARPVFVDIEPETYDLSIEDAGSAVTSRTRAVLPVHLYGHAAAMCAVEHLAAAHGLMVLEDVAQCFGGTELGRPVGSIGHAGALSFFPTKNLGGFGDGGMLVTPDPAVADRARMLRAHGGRRKYFNEVLGYNSRLDELQAALLRVRLRRLDEANASRRRVAQRYLDALAGLPGLQLPQTRPGVEHVFHQFTVRVLGGRRDEVRRRLQEAGVATMVYYPVPVHRLPVYAGLRTRPLPQAERAAQEVLSLPIWPDMPCGSQDRVISAMTCALRH